MDRRLSCNLCESQVNGIGYRTVCQHFLCPSCAQEAFLSTSKCPVCEILLNGTDVRELVVSMPNSSETVDIMFQLVLQSAVWSDVLSNHRALSLAMVDVSMFVNHQLLLDLQKQDNCRLTRDKEIEAARLELVYYNIIHCCHFCFKYICFFFKLRLR